MKWGEEIRSPDGHLRLAMQCDGNLVLYWWGTAIWGTMTHWKGAYRMALTPGGHIQVYTFEDKLLYDKGVDCQQWPEVKLQNDDKAFLYCGATARWRLKF